MPLPRRSDTRTKAPRQRTNVTLRPEHVAEARELGVNLSEAAEHGIVAAITEARAARWLEENRAALDDYNRYVEEHGLPLAKYRLF